MDASTVAKKLAFNLKIIPITGSSMPIGVPFIAMFNPENISIEEGIEWKASCHPGADGADTRYQYTKPRTFKLDFIIDGTGVNTGGTKIPVTAQVALFRTATTGMRGFLHQPAFLLVQYGTFICTCVMNSSNVTYTMFDYTGLPIRAKISASFTERKTSTWSNLLGMLSSPDLTHYKTVKDGDLLPVLTQDVYNNQHYYLQVARVNKLKNFRKLLAGTTLVFPPLADTP